MTTARFRTLQDEVLAWYGVEDEQRYLALSSPSLRIHTIEAGAGEPVLLVHGSGDHAMIWAPRLARLQDEFALAAVDRYPAVYFAAWAAAIHETGTTDSFLSFVRRTIGSRVWPT